MADNFPKPMKAAEIERLLKEATVARVAMVDGVRPYVVPINFGYAVGCRYFKSLRVGRKAGG